MFIVSDSAYNASANGRSYLTKNDGTLITSDEAARLPISTFLSGPTNSVTGAIFLADRKSLTSHGALVLDIGGTTSDVCCVEPSGLPRPAAAFSYLAGIRTNFTIPDLQSIGVGGGSIVRLSEESVTVGPDSVGKDIAVKARSFGGNFLTTTDIMVAAGQENIGDKTLLSNVSPSDIVAVQKQIKAHLEQVIDDMKTSEQDVSLILVGGGSIICPPALDGVSEIKRPPYSQVANAVGAAMAKVSSYVDTIVVLSDASSEEKEVARLRDEAIAQALAKGAQDPQIVEETVLPVPYVATRSRRIMVRAVGRLAVTRPQNEGGENKAALVPEQAAEGAEAEGNNDDIDTLAKDTLATLDQVIIAPKVDLRTYRPSIQGSRWTISRTDLSVIAEGCAILGCGGGGDTYASYLSVDSELARGAVIEVVNPATLPDHGFIPAVAIMGSPSTFSERLPSGEELRNAVRAVSAARNAGINNNDGSSDLTAVMSLEIGGSNGMRGFQAAIWTGKPLVDADLMGRAYPNLWQVTPNNVGITLVPAAAADGKGNTIVQTAASSNHDVEDILRAVCVHMGQASGISLGALTGAQVRSHAAQQSVSLAWRIGRAVQIARAEKHDLVDSILEVYPGRRVVSGKITRVVRDVSGAFTTGSADIVPFSGSDVGADIVRVVFQNENISLTRITREHQADAALATVPDLICVLDAEDGRALGTQDYRYGLRVHVVVLVGSPQWTEGAGLKNGGPEAFG